MTRSTRRFGHPALLSLALLSVPAIFGAAGMAEESATPAKKPMMAGQQYKNIKVLKKLPADRLIPVMHIFNASLGVRCDFCHVINPDHTGFEKDDKPMKNVARRMVVMVQHLNQREKVINNKATCFMCHHGRPEPETQAPSPPPPPSAPPLPGTN